MNEFIQNDESAMRLALAQARLAADADEVPVGAVLIGAEGQVLGSGFNQTISNHDPSAHAEVIALRDAGTKVGNYRYPGATLYVTLEPCMMCMGAILHARLSRVVYGAADPKTGVCGSILQIQDFEQINHHTRVEGGVLGEECGLMLRAFFRERRERQKKRPSEIACDP